MAQFSDDELNLVSPEPMEDIFSDSGLLTGEDLSEIYIGPSPIYLKAQTFSNKILRPLQKYSSLSFGIFALIHGVTVSVGPLISIDVANELLSLGRAIYQSPGLEATLVWGSLGLHVLSGLLIRIVKIWGDKIRYGGIRKKRPKKTSRIRRNDSIVDDKLVFKRNADGTDIEVKDDTQIGLIGGLPSFLGLGPRKNWTFRKLGMTTLQLSGWLTIPFLLYHYLQVRAVPLLVDGDSGYISFEYIAYLFQGSRTLRYIQWFMYSSLVTFGTYHMVSGLVKLFKIKSLRVRRMAVILINLASLSSIFGLWRLSKYDMEFVAGFVIKKFDEYSSFFRGLKFLTFWH